MARCFKYYLVLASGILALETFGQVTRFSETPRVNLDGTLKKINKVPKPIITSEELAQRVAELEKNSEITEKLKKVDLPEDFQIFKSAYANKQILSYGGHFTFLPKHSVLYFPEHLKREVKSEKSDGQALLFWPDFYARYPGLFEKVEVDIEQIRGGKVFSEGKAKLETSKQKILVAHYKNNPVSCHSKLTP